MPFKNTADVLVENQLLKGQVNELKATLVKIRKWGFTNLHTVKYEHLLFVIDGKNKDRKI